MRVRGRWHLAIAGVVALATVVVFVPVLRHGFVNYDDPEYVTENVHVRAGLSWAGVPWAFTAPHAANWHPLTWLSHMLDAQVFGLAPAGHHATSVRLHATSAALLFEVLAGMTGTAWRSAFVAAVFALHPLRVESVPWGSERKDVLAGFFWIRALAAYARYARRRGAADYVLVVAAFVLGLLAKPMVVTLPVVLLLLDVWPLRRPWSIALVWEKLPLVLLAAAASALTVVAQRGAGAMASLESLPLATRMAEAVAGCVALTTRQLEVWRDSVSLFAHATAATRDNYVAEGNLGAALLDQGHRAEAVVHLRQAATINPGYAKVRVSLGKALAESGDPVGALHEYADAIRLDPNTPAAHYNLGLLLAEQGRLDDATAEYREALRLDPEYAKAHHNLGAALAAQGRFEEAVAEYRHALALAPDRGVTHGNLAIALERLGRSPEAVAEYREAVRLMPADPTAHFNLAGGLAGAGHVGEAVAELHQALRLRPDWPEARAALAEVEAQRAH